MRVMAARFLVSRALVFVSPRRILDKGWTIVMVWWRMKALCLLFSSQTVWAGSVSDKLMAAWRLWRQTGAAWASNRRRELNRAKRRAAWRKTILFRRSSERQTQERLLLAGNVPRVRTSVLCKTCGRPSSAGTRLREPASWTPTTRNW